MGVNWTPADSRMPKSSSPNFIPIFMLRPISTSSNNGAQPITSVYFPYLLSIYFSQTQLNIKKKKAQPFSNYRNKYHIALSWPVEFHRVPKHGKIL